MIKNLEIINYEPKRSKAGKEYVRFNTSEGWMSCFDTKTNEELKKFEGKVACVETIESGDFVNIKKCYGEASDEDSEDIEVVKMNNPKNGSQGAMYTSYAKDIFCAIFGAQPYGKSVLKNEWTIEDYMKKSIELVKQAKEAFA